MEPGTWWVIEGRLPDRPWTTIGSREYWRPDAVKRLKHMRGIEADGMKYRLWRYTATVTRDLEDE